MRGFPELYCLSVKRKSPFAHSPLASHGGSRVDVQVYVLAMFPRSWSDPAHEQAWTELFGPENVWETGG